MKTACFALMRIPLGYRYYDYYDYMSSLLNFPMIQFAFLLSAMQAVYLYRFVSSAWLWLAANAAAGALFFWLFVYAFVEASLMSWLVAAIVSSFAGWLCHAMPHDAAPTRWQGQTQRLLKHMTTCGYADPQRPPGC